MDLSLQVAGLVFAILGVALIVFRWSVARACLRATNRTFGSRFGLEGRDASNGRAAVLWVAAVLLFASIAILYGLF